MRSRGHTAETFPNPAPRREIYILYLIFILYKTGGWKLVVGDTDDTQSSNLPVWVRTLPPLPTLPKKFKDNRNGGLFGHLGKETGKARKQEKHRRRRIRIRIENVREPKGRRVGVGDNKSFN